MLESTVTSLMLSCVYRNQSYNRDVKNQSVEADVSKIRVLGSDRTAAVCEVCWLCSPHNAFEIKTVENVFKTSQQANSGDVVKVEVAI